MPEYSVISTSFAKMLGLADKHSYIYRHNRIRSSYFIDNDEKTFSRKDKLHAGISFSIRKFQESWFCIFEIWHILTHQIQCVWSTLNRTFSSCVPYHRLIGILMTIYPHAHEFNVSYAALRHIIVHNIYEYTIWRHIRLHIHLKRLFPLYIIIS